MIELRHQHTKSGVRRTARRVCLSALLAIGLVLVHAGVLASVVDHLPAGATFTHKDDFRRYTTYDAAGATLFGNQSIIQHNSITRPLYSHTGRSSANFWIAWHPHRTHTPYESLSEEPFYFSPPRDIYGHEHGRIATLGYGWPRVALAADYLQTAGMQMTLKNGIRFSPEAIAGRYTRAFPTRVVWRGLVENLALYSFIVYLVLLLGPLLRFPKAALRWKRKRRGLCVQCAYPLEGLAICPECGTEQPGASSPSTSLP